MDRRDFVALCATACAGVLAGCAAMVTHPVPVTDGVARVTLTDHPALAQPNGAIRVQGAGMDDAILVMTEGTGFAALSSTCTHRGCTVDARGDRIVCPCHGSTYDRRGMVLRGPAERALQRYRVHREGDVLLIDLRASEGRS